MTTTSGVKSEVGVLEEVIVHRPGSELLRLTPLTKDEFLFDDLLWVSKAQDEHDQFTAALQNSGTRVLYLKDLLTETLHIPQAREFLLELTFDERSFGPGAATSLREIASDLPADDLVKVLISGWTKREILAYGRHIHSLALLRLELDALALAPLPNHLYTRDASAWIYDGVAVNSMQKAARIREAATYEAIYRWHPRFADRKYQNWSLGRQELSASVEGGDVFVLGDGALLVGMSERTTASGVERLAQRLFQAGSANRVLALELPKARSYMHLDTVMTMVDENSFVEYSGLGEIASYTLTPKPSTTTSASKDPSIEPNGDFHRADTLKIVAHPPGRAHHMIAEVMGKENLRILTADQDARSAAREQWDDGCNALAIAPGVVITYDRTPTSNRLLRDAGLEVIEVPGGELGRGRGGPRCMSCPTQRQAVTS